MLRLHSINGNNVLHSSVLSTKFQRCILSLNTSYMSINLFCSQGKFICLFRLNFTILLIFCFFQAFLFANAVKISFAISLKNLIYKHINCLQILNSLLLLNKKLKSKAVYTKQAKQLRQAAELLTIVKSSSMSQITIVRFYK